ncbi:hypothetical protein QCN29_32360 [Streptomyces sp. HNM0663]|uniref:Uncharacterized protein n=1 Tax=Streptomyces chengmaiensis TaxID=3040919 RepID=A0ABT6HYJ0_9ACTN|nr:hypothetical protein [Streptomyces chengmaiensis]MDH2393377.1 hypothetical protein [Streptomyces chengmaiensis]
MHHHAAGPPPGRAPGGNSYLDQVRELCPRRLLDREAEVAELAAFSTDPDDAAPAYAWWRAGPWAGKSALMAWYVLHPPPGAEVVAFFITARYAGQNTREAFLETVIPQLATLAGVGPDLATGERRQRDQLFALYRQAAEAARERGARLVLLLDGIDEDGGITAGPSAHSIAALLPQRAPGGLRVLAAGRPNPPIPDDVAPGHPLRDPSVVRELAPSPHARAIRADARNSLHHLLEDTGGLGHDVLGLITAAGGGLTLEDLSELTDAPPYQVGARLRSTAARTFLTQRSRYGGGQGRELYILGHEELQQASVESFGPRLLAAFRDRLHAWAEGYAERGWPESTPEYLLRGYTRMLGTEGHADRLTVLALDLARQERLLDVTGGDAVAERDLARAQDLHGDADLAGVARLALHRYRLTSRDSDLDPRLSALWYRAGHVTRAENFAYNLTNPARRAAALGALAEAAWRNEDRRRAATLLAEAEVAARGASSEGGDRPIPTDVAAAAISMADWDTAERLLRGNPASERDVALLAKLAQGIAEAGEQQRSHTVLEWAAEALESMSGKMGIGKTLCEVARAAVMLGAAQRGTAMLERRERHLRRSGVAGPSLVWELPALAEAAAVLGDGARACALFQEAVDFARSAAGGANAVREMAQLAETAWRLGDQEKACRLLAEAESAVGMLPVSQRQEPMPAIARAAAAAGDWQRAVEAVRSLGDHERLVLELVLVTELAINAGQGHLTEYWLLEAEVRWAAAAGSTAPSYPVTAMSLARSMARVGRWEAAERIARAVEQPRGRATALVQLAEVAVDGDDAERTTVLLTEAEATVRARVDPDLSVGALSVLARVAASQESGACAQELFSWAERAARAVARPRDRVLAQAEVAESLVRAGHLQRGERLAWELPRHHAAQLGLALVGRAVAEGGQLARGAVLIEAAAQLDDLDGMPDADRRENRAFLAQCAAAVGDVVRADAFARAGHSGGPRVGLLAMAEAHRVAGEVGKAAEAVTAASRQPLGVWGPFDAAGVVGRVAVAVYEAGDPVRAVSLARRTPTPGSRAAALAGVAEAASAAGHLAEARRLAADAGAILDAASAASAQDVEEVALATARCGLWEHAEKLARGIGPQHFRAETLTHLGAEARRIGDEARAGGLLGAAEQAARAISDAQSRAARLAGVADALGGGTEARRLAAEVLRVPWEDQVDHAFGAGVLRPRISRWPEDLEMLAKVAPEALAALADEFLRVFPVPVPVPTSTIEGFEERR